MNQHSVITRQDAMAAGLKTYFTGKPCCRGHVELRWVSSKECVICRKLRRPAPTDADRERVRRWWAENPEKAKNRPRDLEGQRKRYSRWAAKNKDKIAERGRAYYQKNREAILAKARAKKSEA